jgi:hypothetical protein
MTELVAVPTPKKSELPGTNILIEGPTGRGKTTSIGTLVDSGIETFVLFTENGLETLLGYWKDKGKEVPPNLHWHTLSPFKESWKTMIEAATKVNEIPLDQWAKMTDPNRGSYSRFIDLLKLMSNFEDQRTEEKFGPVDTWGTGRALVMDSLTGLGYFAMALVIGGKPVKSLPEWGAAQDVLERLLRQMCDGCRCHFILTAHIEREVDLVQGGTRMMASTLGKALAPKLPPMFSDVILAVREGTKFTWDTIDAGADLKARNLPMANGLPQDFSAIINKWKSRGGIVEVV